MSIVPYLAMTAAEFRAAPSLPEKIGWMACHFSPYSTGLSNLPEELPEGSLLILNDRTPIHGHDPELIARQLHATMQRLKCCGILLDFQTADNSETAALIRYLAENLPDKVIFPAYYPVESEAVFLPPVPVDEPVKDYLAPWQGKEIWLDAAPEGTEILLTESGAVCSPLSGAMAEELPHVDEALHCHYRIDETETGIRFLLLRTKEDLQALLLETEALGVAGTVGLYQELR